MSGQPLPPGIGNVLPRCEEAIVQRNKVERYLLDRGHPDGAHKAHVFERALGYEPQHCELLQAELKRAVQLYPVIRVEKGYYPGAWKCTVDLIVGGPNGNEVWLRTGWEAWSEPRAPSFLSARVRGESWPVKR